jgi:preprotein translocase subunit Sss1
MTQVHGNAAPNAASPEERTSLGRLIGAGLILVGLVLLALGAFLGPYTYATATQGKLTVETCTIDYKYRSSTSSGSRKKTKTRYCYGTFTSTNGTTKDLNAELKSDALHTRGYVIEALKTGDTTYKQDHGWVGAIATGCVWFFGALIPLAIGFFGAVTGFSSGQAPSQRLFRTCLTLVVVGVIGLIISLLVSFFA